MHIAEAPVDHAMSVPGNAAQSEASNDLTESDWEVVETVRSAATLALVARVAFTEVPFMNPRAGNVALRAYMPLSFAGAPCIPHAFLPWATSAAPHAGGGMARRIHATGEVIDLLVPRGGRSRLQQFPMPLAPSTVVAVTMSMTRIKVLIMPMDAVS